MLVNRSGEVFWISGFEFVLSLGFQVSPYGSYQINQYQHDQGWAEESGFTSYAGR
jgi:hypothetical protein